ncbi:hypothetical protein ACFZDK_54955 [Streptomyces sp. NPDC007901]|uniref:hypothetical protein n=1 Tax=Streptomyces sp. NPDC007901 TaxID=3364785 RepID=UPI0036E77E66
MRGRRAPAGQVHRRIGRHPFGTGNAEAVAFRVLNADPDLGGVPDDLLSLVTACLAKEPGRRPSSAAVAQQSAELLGEQATQVLADVHDRPTEVPNLIAEQWHPPRLSKTPSGPLQPRAVQAGGPGSLRWQPLHSPWPPSAPGAHWPRTTVPRSSDFGRFLRA